MNIGIALTVICIAIYLGKIIGLYILCDSISELNIAKCYAAYMPLISIVYLLQIIFGKRYVGIARVRALRVYFNLNWSMVIAYAYAEVLREKKRSVITYKRPRRSSFFVLKDAILTVIQSNTYTPYN